MQGLGVTSAVEVFHECDERGAAGWCAGSVVGDLVCHSGFVSSEGIFSCRKKEMRRSPGLAEDVYFINEGNIGRDASDLINDHIERGFSFYFFIWTNRT